MRVLGVIPARFGATRFPGKVLARLAGKPLIVHVIERAREAGSIGRLVVATDDDRVAEVSREAGVEVRMTDPALPSGSDRVARVASSCRGEGDIFDLVVNFQGDEPLLPGEAADRAVEALGRDSGASLATLAVPATPNESDDPNVVKVVVDGRGRALYFSRARIPHGGEEGADRDARTGQSRSGVLKHIGLYVFRAPYLDRFVELPPSPLERRERLEQLRALEDGAAITVATGDWQVRSVDTPADLERVEALMTRESTR